MSRIFRSIAPAAAGLMVLALIGCAAPRPPQKPSFYRSLASSGAEIDATAARDMINAYRANNGRAALALDPALMAIAEREAGAMAAADRVGHATDRGNRLEDRLKAGSYSYKSAVENVSAGYHTFAEAFSGWRESDRHNKNMLDGRATRMGIATAYAPGTKYKVFWSLILAEPN
ncbi:MAG: CAP domain-containing protein [Hyphomicrobiales bacterium]|nr:CAP domain-containing protein [Hyphomicrobiales bacterium]